MTPITQRTEFTTSEPETQLRDSAEVPATPKSSRSRQSAAASERGREYVRLALSRERQLRRHLTRMLGPHPDVSDLLQEVYLHLLLAGDENSPTIRSLSAYAMAVARNRAFDWRRHSRVIAALAPPIDIDVTTVAAEGEHLEDLLSAEQELKLFFEAVDALPTRCGEVFMMRKVYGMTHREIGAALGITVHTAERHIAQATQLLGHTLRHYGPRHALLYPLRTRMMRFSAKAKARRLKDTGEPRKDPQTDNPMPPA